MTIRIALIGDFSADITAHLAIPRALELEGDALGAHVQHEWLATAELDDPSVLSGYDAGWVVPASPYVSMDNALAAIRYLRKTGTPFLGTCGGYQHALVEYARNVLGLSEAGITEVDPDCPMPLVSGLICALIDQEDPVIAAPGSRLATLVGTAPLQETYRCSFGLNPDFEHVFDGTAFKPAAYDPYGAVRAMELDGHPFFLGSAFQPERAALVGRRHPVVTAFASAALRHHRLAA